MEYVNLGRTGLKVSRLALGTMQFGWSLNERESYRVLSAAFDSGINFFDTADIYSNWVEGNSGGVSETYLGNWIKKAKIPRDRLILATKVGGETGKGPNDQGLGRVHIMRAVEASLKRLQVDTIDLYQSHFPDNNTPIDETLRAYDDLFKQGKVRCIGASNYKAIELKQALWTSDKFNLARYDCVQIRYNLTWRKDFESEIREVCQEYGIGVIPYSPLAGGFLTGKYRKGEPLPKSPRAEKRKQFMTERNLSLLTILDEISRAHNATVSQVSLAWILADEIVTSPIIGATSVEQLNQNIGVLNLELSLEERSLLGKKTDWKKE